MFLDQAVIRVKSGKGGDGVVHFRREKYVPRGGPDGGDGGNGGDVILEVKRGLNTLTPFKYQKEFQAAQGGNGAGGNCTGKSAPPLILAVPAGTMVYDAETDQLLGDLVEEGQQLLVCKGGRGGRGNARFATSRNQVPRIAEKGEPGEERLLRLELKLIADVGIVGLPNAGKSTLLAKVTRANPKIAPYPFTTLTPNLGVCEVDEDTTIVLADIPGLIEGAHRGVGLGHDFLRHIQRTRVLIHMLDGSAEDPLTDFSQINSELALFDPALKEKPQIVAFNKIDIPGVRERWENVQAELKRKGYSGLPISALTGENVRALMFQTVGMLKEALAKQAEAVPLEEEDMPVYRYIGEDKGFRIKREDKGWRIEGKAIERAAAMTYWEYDQSVRRFQRLLEKLGVDDALRAEGIQAGQTVFIGDFEFEWED
jgi:GTP-binding protein